MLNMDLHVKFIYKFKKTTTMIIQIIPLIKFSTCYAFWLKRWMKCESMLTIVANPMIDDNHFFLQLQYGLLNIHVKF